MKTLKMSLENIQGKMSRKEMRNIMVGSACTIPCHCNGQTITVCNYQNCWDLGCSLS